MVIITGEHLATDDDNTYSYVHVLDEPVVEDDYYFHTMVYYVVCVYFEISINLYIYYLSFMCAKL